MPLVLLLTSEILEAHYDEENTWLYLDWKGPQKLALVQAACQQISQLLVQTGARKILNDNTHITQTSWELVQWVAGDYLPELGHAGVEYVAWVSSPLLECRGHVDKMNSFVGQKPQIAIFDDMAEAYTWLNSVLVGVPTRIEGA